MSYYKVLLYVGLTIAVVPFLMVLFKRKPHSPDVRYMIPMAGLIAFGGLYEFIFTRTLRIDPTIWFKVYTLLEFLVIYYFLKKLTNGRHRTFFTVMIVLFFMLFFALQIIYWKYGHSNTDSLLVILQTLLVYTGSLFWFKDVFTNMTLTTLWDSPAFYFVSGLILYFSGTLFLYLMADFVLTTSESQKFWVINVILSLFLSIIIILGIWKDQKLRRYSGSEQA